MSPLRTHRRRSPLRLSAAAVAVAALAGGLLTLAPAAAGAATPVVATSAGLAAAGSGGASIKAASLDSGVAAAKAALARPDGVPGFDIFEGSVNSAGNLLAAADFVTAKNNGAAFAYIKASGGILHDNKQFDTQFNGAKAAGLLVGTYFKVAPNAPNGTAKEQADYFAAHDGQWKAGGWTLPPMIDIETNDPTGNNNGQPGVPACYGLTSAQMVAWIQAAAAETQAKIGRAPVLYIGTDFADECINGTTALSAWPLWSANYTQSPVAHGLPASWASYSFWQYSGTANSPLPGDQDVFNGNLQSLHLLADPTWGSGTVKSKANHDYSGDGKADVLTRTSGGSVQLHAGTGKGTFAAAKTVATGFNAYSAVVASGDANGDGIPDVYVRTSGGTLSFRPGIKGGGFGPAVSAATGTNTLNLFVGVGDFNGDGKADLLARDTKGVLWLYIGNGTGRFSPDTSSGATGLATRVQLGSGWNVMSSIVGVDNFTGTGTPGIVTQTPAGAVSYYARTSTGFASHTSIGSGWSVYNALVSPGDLTGDGVSDLLVRNAKTGQISIYPGAGNGKLSARVPGVTGWAPYVWIG